MLIYRQGDVMFVSCDGIPSGAKRLSLDRDHAVSKSEVTGHRHFLVSDDKPELWDSAGCIFLTSPHLVRLRHDEHGTIYLVKGTYQQVFQVGAVDRSDFVPGKKGELLAEDPRFGKLHEYGGALVVAEVINATPEKDGARKTCWLPVKASLYDGDAGRIVQAAVASTWRTTPGGLELFFKDWRKYDPTVET